MGRRGQAIGCEVIVSGKVRGQRAKAQKYAQGYQVSTGQPKYDFIDQAVRSVELRQGVLGLKVKIMQGTRIKIGNKEKVMPDFIQIEEPKDDNDDAQPEVISAQNKDQQQERTPPSDDFFACVIPFLMLRELFMHLSVMER